MANLSINRGTSEKPANLGTADWEPARLLRELFRWDPFAAGVPSPWALETSNFVPAFEIKETKESFLFKADMPGIKESDLDVKLAQNRLTVSGKRESEKSEKGETYYTTERSYGSFTRTFALPEGVDAERVRAELKEGVLSIELPKRPETQAKKVAIKT